MRSHNEYVVALHAQLDAAIRQIAQYRHRSLDAAQERSILHLLERAHEFGRACLVVEEADLSRALWVLNRALLETLFLTAWVALSETNAVAYAGGGIGSLARNARSSFQRGTAKVHDDETGHDKTADAIADIRQLEKRLPPIQQIADQCGLAVVYDSLYRLASLEVHGVTLDLPITENREHHDAVLQAVTSMIQACLLIADNCIQSRRVTSREELFRVLGLPKPR